ncbi:solute carrier family 22 member 7 [Ornithorhynchus anatinus]|uniref:Solute carrier family 22 member 7 n=1 Tax=Ornithorhynchus anatinus TaxID=9258 RepID=F6QQB1_ORNAN|nr:solute carrier family 22 member 7 [Ornithorhynchus anatinus]
MALHASPSPQASGFEEVLAQAGSFGPFQIRNLLLLALPRLLLPLHFLLPIFLAAVPPHRCALLSPHLSANFSEEAWLQTRLPRDPEGTFSSCHRFIRALSPPLSSNSSVGNGTEKEVGAWPDASVEPCLDGWVYNRSQFSSTITTQWDLVCERKGLNQITVTSFFVGVLVGAVLFGYLADRFGRRPLLLVAYVGSLILGLISAASSSFAMFLVTRTLTGTALAGFTIIILPLELEWLDVKHRTVAGVISSTFWSLGATLLALVGYLIRDWRWLLLAVTLPCAPGIVSLWWVPESARWLLTQGRVREARRYLLRCAALNHRDGTAQALSMEALNKIAVAEKSRHHLSYLDLFRTRRLRTISLLCMVVWFGVNFSYYGMSLDVDGLGLDIYQIQLLFGAVELPSKLLVFLAVRYAGRRPTQAGALLGTAISLGAILLLPPGKGTWRSALAVLGKGFSEAAFTTAFLFTSELYPTVLRQMGMGLVALVGRLGGSLAPLAMLLAGVWAPLPKVAYGSAALLAAAMALLLPETRQAQLPETIQDIERKGPAPSSQEEVVQLKLLQD